MIKLFLFDIFFISKEAVHKLLHKTSNYLLIDFFYFKRCCCALIATSNFYQQSFFRRLKATAMKTGVCNYEMGWGEESSFNDGTTMDKVA